MLDLSSFRLEKLIVHDIPTSVAGAARDPVLSDAVSPCPVEVRRFFETRLFRTLDQAGRAIRFLDEPTSPVPDRIKHLLSAPRSDIVVPSQHAARHLHAVQSGRNSPGLLCLGRGKIRQGPVVVVIKLEREEGIQVRLSEGSGPRTFDLLHLKDLILNKHTRVFKTALFFSHDESPSGILSDEQLQRGQLADFFLQRFLGCTLCMEPDVVTEKYLDAVEEFVRRSIASGEAKTRSHAALIVDLSSNRGTIDPRGFARDHLDASSRDAFVEALRERGLPISRFPKDTSRIDKRLAKSRIRFTNGVYVTVPLEAADAVRVDDLPKSRSRLTVEGEISRVDGKAR